MQSHTNVQVTPKYQNTHSILYIQWLSTYHCHVIGSLGHGVYIILHSARTNMLTYGLDCFFSLNLIHHLLTTSIVFLSVDIM